MEFKPGFDDELLLKHRQRRWPFRSIGSLMIVVAACGIVLTVFAVRSRKQATMKWPQVRPRPLLTLAQLRAQNPPANALMEQLPDRFVTMADPSIDPRMVVAAPAGIDDAMVFNPNVRRAQPGLAAPGAGQPPNIPKGQLAKPAARPRVGPQLAPRLR